MLRTTWPSIRITWKRTWPRFLARAQQRLEQRQHAATRAALSDELSKPFAASAQLSYRSVGDCPVCGEEGSLEGEDYGDVAIDYPEQFDDMWTSPTERLQVHAIYLGCANYHLVLDRLEFLEEAGVATTFTIERNYEPDEYDYGND